MTALDHLRAVLAVTNDKAYRTAGDQDVIEQAKRFASEFSWVTPHGGGRLYWCLCCQQTGAERAGHFAHAVAIIDGTQRYGDDGLIVGALKDRTDTWECVDPVCHRCRPQPAYERACSTHDSKWADTLAHNIYQAAWLAGQGPDCGRYNGKWYPGECG